MRSQVKRGADVIKLTATGGVLSNTAAGVEQQFFDDELTAIVETGLAIWSGDKDGGTLILRGQSNLLDDVTALEDLERRLLAALRARHERKGRFIERLDAADLG